MTNFIELDRKFYELSMDQIADTEFLTSIDESLFESILTWNDILKFNRVILLAEAGSGKTKEMQQKVYQLTQKGEFAFFFSLESLCHDKITDLISYKDEELFCRWKQNNRKYCWFFLDAVDELKLISGNLDKALLRLSKDIGDHIDLARFIISSRPNDWCHETDIETVSRRLPFHPKKIEESHNSPEDFFIEILKHDSVFQADVKDNESHEIADNKIRVVALLPLNKKQIQFYAEQTTIQDTTYFIKELEQKNAWTFARRPLDILELIEIWKSTKCLGTRVQQHEMNIAAKLKDRPYRVDSNVLTEIKAREGAERLALALTLTRTRTIKSPEQPLDSLRKENILDSSRILKDWTESERNTLLRKALFDPATYGRIKFHHRSVQEYLAARHLQRLRDNGLSIKSLLRLLFTQNYGIEVVIPSLRPVAAWLALWNADVCNELIKREPETLLTFGDPEALSIRDRGNIIHAFAIAYGKGGWRGLSIPIDEIQRLAHPDLAPIIQKLWDKGQTNEEVRKLLIRIIWKGKLDKCANITYNIATDKTCSDSERITAIQALAACNETELVQDIITSILTNPNSWAKEIIFGIAPLFFPKLLTTDDLIGLIKMTAEPKRTIGGFNWALQLIAKSIDPWSNQAIILRDKVADIIWQCKSTISDYFNIKSKKSYLVPGLAILCERQINSPIKSVNYATIRACIIANYFGKKIFTTKDRLDALKKFFSNEEAYRPTIFWNEFDIMNAVSPTRSKSNCIFKLEHNSLIGHLKESDSSWLLETLSDDTEDDKRCLALYGLIRIWHPLKQYYSKINIIKAAINNDQHLEKILVDATTPYTKDAESERLEQEYLLSIKKSQDKENNRIGKWIKWRISVVNDPDEAFSLGKKYQTTRNIVHILYTLQETENNSSIWNKDIINYIFNSRTLLLAETALQDLWRNIKPLFWSEKRPQDRNSTPYNWLYGLCGVYVASANKIWTSLLSQKELRLAIRYSTLELNGFAPFIYDITSSYPELVESELGKELSEELSYISKYTYLQILERLICASCILKKLFFSQLITTLSLLPDKISDDESEPLTHNLDNIFSILTDTDNIEQRQALAQICANKYANSSHSKTRMIWLKGLFMFDIGLGLDILLNTLRSFDEPTQKKFAIDAFSTVFGSHHNPIIKINGCHNQVIILSNLVRTAYSFIRIEDDLDHEEPYTPDNRDKAKRVREFLLSTLIKTPGEEAWRVLVEISHESDFKLFSDRLSMLAREKAANESEFQAHTADEIAILEQRFEMPPKNARDLFYLMMDRLDDLKFIIYHHDFTDKNLLLSIAKEEDMQRTLALRIESLSNNMFTVTREEEVADKKRTDIRLLTSSNDKSVIEIKIADKWSLSELEKALTNQLVQQYLRSNTCSSGCLLLTYHGTKNFWTKPQTKKRLAFHEVISYLAKKAATIEISKKYKLRLAVFGLDLTPSRPVSVGNNRHSHANG